MKTPEEYAKEVSLLNYPDGTSLRKVIADVIRKAIEDTRRDEKGMRGLEELPADSFRGKQST